jgi:alpha-tubulin suppressor-like RCC1 family protein
MFPERIESLLTHTVVKLAASENHTVALTATGHVWCWGSDRCVQA